MNSSVAALQKCDISFLEKDLYVDGILQVKPYSYYKDIPTNVILYFAYVHGIYVFPTTELIEWFKNNIEGSAIEIGAGHGAVARTLKIPITDNRMQEDPAIKEMYLLMGQVPITYNDDVLKYDAIEAIDKFKPDTVIGCFITQLYNETFKDGNMLGVDEFLLLSKVKKYMIVGNLHTHQHKAILKLPHEALYFDWLITRAINKSLNRIFIFKGNII